MLGAKNHTVNFHAFHASFLKTPPPPFLGGLWLTNVGLQGGRRHRGLAKSVPCHGVGPLFCGFLNGKNDGSLFNGNTMVISRGNQGDVVETCWTWGMSWGCYGVKWWYHRGCNGDIRRGSRVDNGARMGCNRGCGGDILGVKCWYHGICNGEVRGYDGYMVV